MRDGGGGERLEVRRSGGADEACDDAAGRTDQNASTLLLMRFIRMLKMLRLIKVSLSPPSSLCSSTPLPLPAPLPLFLPLLAARSRGLTEGKGVRF